MIAFKLVPLPEINAPIRMGFAIFSPFMVVFTD
jgi:hypothetical protein